MRNVDLYGLLLRVSGKLHIRRVGVAGHSVHYPELAASSLVLWEPTQDTIGLSDNSLPAWNMLGMYVVTRTMMTRAYYASSGASHAHVTWQPRSAKKE